jgi:hypothetical protein
LRGELTLIISLKKLASQNQSFEVVAEIVDEVLDEKMGFQNSDVCLSPEESVDIAIAHYVNLKHSTDSRS